MKREILFRAKELNTGEWIYGIVFPHDDGSCTMLYQHPMDGSLEGCEVDPDTVGQLTELYDKHGNPIFEGDIVLKRTYRGKDHCSVRFDGGMFHCGWGGGSSTPTHRYTLEDKRIEVVGNIYDNQELMTQ